MQSRTLFRFEAGDVRFELEGTEDFVRRNLPVFLPFVTKVVGPAKPSPASAASGDAAVAAPATGSADPKDLPAWWEKSIPRGTRVSLQDMILVFAFWMRGFRKFIFTSEDIRRAFEAVGQSEPKSLLQILGTLKRDHNLILGTERRGEYMLNTTGIDRVRGILGIQTPQRDARQAPQAPPSPPTAESRDPRDMNDAERAARAILDI